MFAGGVSFGSGKVFRGQVLEGKGFVEIGGLFEGGVFLEDLMSFGDDLEFGFNVFDVFVVGVAFEEGLEGVVEFFEQIMGVFVVEDVGLEGVEELLEGGETFVDEKFRVF